MKAALNGVLNCSILDGWWDEMIRRRRTASTSRRSRTTTTSRAATTARRHATFDVIENADRAAVLRPQRRRRPAPLDRTAGQQLGDARLERQRQPHGARLRDRAVRAGGRVRPSPDRRRRRRRPRARRLEGARRRGLARACTSGSSTDVAALAGPPPANPARSWPSSMPGRSIPATGRAVRPRSAARRRFVRRDPPHRRVASTRRREQSRGIDRAARVPARGVSPCGPLPTHPGLSSIYDTGLVASG